MPASRIFTAAAIGKLANISLYLIPDPRTPRKPGRAMLRFVHLSPDAPPVNLAIANGKTLFTNIPYKGITDYTALMPGKYNFELNLAQDGKRVLWVPNIRIMPHRNYSIYAVGLAGGQPPLRSNTTGWQHIFKNERRLKGVCKTLLLFMPESKRKRSPGTAVKIRRQQLQDLRNCC